MKKFISLFLVIFLFSLPLTGCGNQDKLEETKLNMMNSNIKTERLLTLCSENKSVMDEVFSLFNDYETFADISLNDIKGYLAKKDYEKNLETLRKLVTTIDFDSPNAEVNLSLIDNFILLNSDDEQVLQLISLDLNSSYNLYLYFTWENSKITNIEYSVI